MLSWCCAWHSAGLRFEKMREENACGKVARNTWLRTAGWKVK